MHACTSHTIEPANCDMLAAARAAQRLSEPVDLQQTVIDLAIIVRGLLSTVRALEDRQTVLERERRGAAWVGPFIDGPSI